MSVNHLRYYFNVSNLYVLSKLRLLLFPFRHPSWSRISSVSDNVYKPPREDINAPDLYIPSMAYVTYILLTGISLGKNQKFTPDVLGLTASSAFFIVLFQILAIKLGSYLMNISSDVSWTDLLAYCGYKFIPINLILILKFFFGSTVVYGIFFYLMLASGFFIVIILFIFINSYELFDTWFYQK